MRTVIVSAVFLLSAAAWSAPAQPPAGSPPDSGKIVIRPGGKGAETVPGTRLPTGGAGPDEKDGFIVIRPGGKGVLTTTTPTTSPKQPTPVQPAGGMLNVPQPGPQPAPGKDEKDG